MEGLDEGYIEDLKQPFLFHQSGTSSAPGNLPTSAHHPHQQQINSIIKASSSSGGGGVLNFHQHQQTATFIPNPQQQPFQGPPSELQSSGRRANDHLPMVYPPGTTTSSVDRGANNHSEYDPYSYVYDSQIQEDHLLLRSTNNTLVGSHLNNFVVDSNGTTSELVGFNGQRFPNKVILAATLSNTSSLQGLPPSVRTGFGGPPTTNEASSDDEDQSENEYEEIQEVARYMNSASLHDPNHPDSDNLLISTSSSVINTNTKAGSVNSSSSPDGNYEYDSVHPNYDDVGLSSNNIDSLSNLLSATGIEGEVNAGENSAGNNNELVSSSGASSSTSNNPRRSPPLGPPRHFKSFSSTDDILAEVVQVQQKHDRVLDQLNLEVENLLIRSTKQEIEQNELNFQRSHQNNMMLLRNGQHTHSHQQSADHPPHECLIGAKCYYCNESSAEGSGSGSCPQKDEQMLSGSTSSTEVVMNVNGITANNANIVKGDGNGNNEMMEGSCNCCCCCGCCSSSVGGDNNGSAVASSSTKDKSCAGWRETLKASLLSGFHNHAQHNHYQSVNPSGKGKCETTKVINSSSTSVACISAVGAANGGGTFSRKKKLDRNAPGQLSDTNLKHKLNTLSAIQSHNEQFQMLLKERQKQSNSSSCTSLCMDSECALIGKKSGSGRNMSVLHTLHHHHNHHLLQGQHGGLLAGGKGWKGRYQRSHSLIPNWKIRDHLMRLPFLRQHKGNN